MAKTQGSGSIVQLEKDKPKNKCRKWQLRVCTGADTRTGKYLRKTRTVKGSYSEAKAKLREFIEEVDANKVQGRTSWTFKDFCDHYIEQRELKKEIAGTTVLRQQGHFKAACHHIGKAKLEAITPVMLNNMYIAMLKGDTLSGRPSGGSYVNQIHDNIKLVFDQAIKEGVLVENPCLKADPPKMDTKEKRALKPEQAHLLIAMLDEKDDHDMAYLLAITMGLRRGEICGLSWGDIDFERGIVDICHAYDILGNLKQTKTKAGMRLLPLSEFTAQALKTHKEAQLARFEKTNSYRKPWEGYIKQDDTTPVIAHISGGRVLPNKLSEWWTADRVKFGLEGWCLHELRNTALSEIPTLA